MGGGLLPAPARGVVIGAPGVGRSRPGWPLELLLAVDHRERLYGLDHRFPLLYRLDGGRIRLWAQLADQPLPHRSDGDPPDTLPTLVAGRHVWVQRPAVERLYRVDTGSGRVTATQLPGGASQLVATARGIAGLLRGDRGGRLLLVDDGGATLTDLADLAAVGPGFGTESTALAASGDHLWFVDGATMTLLELTIGTGALRLERQLSLRPVAVPPWGEGLRMAAGAEARHLRAGDDWRSVRPLIASASPLGVATCIDHCPAFVPWGGEPRLLTGRRDLDPVAVERGTLWLTGPERDAAGGGRRPGRRLVDRVSPLLRLPLADAGPVTPQKVADLPDAPDRVVAAGGGLFWSGFMVTQQRSRLLRLDLGTGLVAEVPVPTVDPDRWMAPEPSAIRPQLPAADWFRLLRDRLVEAFSGPCLPGLLDLVSVEVVGTGPQTRVELVFTWSAEPGRFGLWIAAVGTDRSADAADDLAGSLHLQVMEELAAGDRATWVREVTPQVTWLTFTGLLGPGTAPRLVPGWVR